MYVVYNTCVQLLRLCIWCGYVCHVLISFCQGIGVVIQLNYNLIVYLLPFPPGPSPPSVVNMIQNGAGSVLVSWKPPLSGPAVTKYMIYCKQRDSEQMISKSAEATASSATINGLVTGEVCSITMVAFSNEISSTETEAKEVIIHDQQGMQYNNRNKLYF